MVALEGCPDVALEVGLGDGRDLDRGIVVEPVSVAEFPLGPLSFLFTLVPVQIAFVGESRWFVVVSLVCVFGVVES